MTPAKSNHRRIKEKDLPKHLTGDNEAARAETDVHQTDKSDSMNPAFPKLASTYSNNMALAARDYQLNEALTLLKGLHILKGMATPKK